MSAPHVTTEAGVTIEISPDDPEVRAIAAELSLAIPRLRELAAIAVSHEAYRAAWDGGPSYDESEERRAEWLEIHRRRERVLDELTSIGRRLTPHRKAATA